MLKEDQMNYLKTISESSVANIKPWDPKSSELADSLIAQIKLAVPGLEVFYSGATALKIAGQNDIDFSILSPVQDFEKHLPALVKVLGEPQKKGKANIRWDFIKDGYNIDVHLSDPGTEAIKEHKEVFKLLKQNPKLLQEYEILKINSNGLPLREYMKRKYEFYNRILGYE